MKRTARTLFFIAACFCTISVQAFGFSDLLSLGAWKAVTQIANSSWVRGKVYDFFHQTEKIQKELDAKLDAIKKKFEAQYQNFEEQKEDAEARAGYNAWLLEQLGHNHKESEELNSQQNNDIKTKLDASHKKQLDGLEALHKKLTEKTSKLAQRSEVDHEKLYNEINGLNREIVALKKTFEQRGTALVEGVKKMPATFRETLENYKTKIDQKTRDTDRNINDIGKSLDLIENNFDQPVAGQRSLVNTQDKNRFRLLTNVRNDGIFAQKTQNKFMLLPQLLAQ